MPVAGAVVTQQSIDGVAVQVATQPSAQRRPSFSSAPVTYAVQPFTYCWPKFTALVAYVAQPIRHWPSSFSTTLLSQHFHFAYMKLLSGTKVSLAVVV